MDALAWTNEALKRLQIEFGKRLCFVGIQGSHARGEAHENSDIDLVVLLDDINANDLVRYRAIVKTMPHSELACGFIGSRQTLAAWPRHELFQFYHDTHALFGALPEINLFTKDDALEAARIGASGVYHATCHAYVFDDNTIDNILKELFKSTFFILQALQFARTGIYSRTKVDIASQLEGDDASIFKICSNWKENKPKNDTERHNLIDLLLRWSKNIIKIK